MTASGASTPPGGRGLDPRLKRRLLSGAVDDNLRAIRNQPRKRLYRRPPVARRLASGLLALGALAGGVWILWFRPIAVHSEAAAGAIASAAVPLSTANLGPASPATDQGLQEILDLPGSESGALPTRLAAGLFPLAVHRIVLDPGHGGTDEGTKTPIGLTEKALTLDIAQRLALLLMGDGFDVSMTRDTDKKLYLRDRVRFANQVHADLFVSIHVNWFKDGRANRGIETYYLGPSDDPFITELASAENRESGYALADVRKLLDGIYSDLRQQESRRLAAAVQRRLVGTVREINREVRDRGVRSAPFLVLVETEMPAILAEVASLSSPEEARLLAQADYRERLARALFDGIRAYSLATEQLAEEKGTR